MTKLFKNQPFQSKNSLVMDHIKSETRFCFTQYEKYYYQNAVGQNFDENGGAWGTHMYEFMCKKEKWNYYFF